MVARIQPYEQQVTPAMAAERRPRALASDVGGALVGQSLYRAGAEVGQLSDTLAHRDQVLRNLEDQKAVDDAHLQLSTAAGDMFKLQKDMQEASPDDPSGFTDQYIKGFEEYQGELLGKTSNPKARAFLQRGMAQLKEHLFVSSIGWQADQKGRYNLQRVQDASQGWGRAVAQDETAYETARAQLMGMIDTTLTPRAREVARDAVDKSLAASAFEGFAARNPRLAQSAVNKRLGIPPPEPAPERTGRAPSGSTTSFNDAITYLLGPTGAGGVEGGYVSSDGRSKAPANFGINQKANPDVNVATLTREKAINLYRLRYWNKIGADKMPGPLALVAFDAAVQSGPETAAKMVRDADGDPMALIAQRRAFYENLAATNPADKANLPGWMRRMDVLEANVRAMQVANSSPSKMADAMEAGVTDVQAATPEQLEPITVTHKLGVPFLDRMDVPQLLAAKAKADHFVREDQADAQSQLRALYHNAGAQADHGVVPDVPPPDLVARAVGPQRSGEEVAKFDNLRTYAGAIGRVQTMTPGDMSAAAVKLGPIDKNDPEWADKTKQAETFAKAGNLVLKQRTDDPIAAARDQGLGRVNPIDWNDPVKARAELAQRQGVALNMATRYGGSGFSALTKDEAKAYGDNFHRLPTTGQLDVLVALRSSLTNPEVYRSTVAAFAQDSPPAMFAADVATRAGTAPDGTPARAVALGVLEGDRLLNPDKSARKEDGHGREYTLPKTGGSDGMDAYIANELGPAFIEDAVGFAKAKQTIYAYYAHLSSRAGAFAEPTFDSNTLDTAIDSTVGARSKWSTGFFSSQHVLMPWGVTDEQFRPQIAGAYGRAMERAGLRKTALDNPENYQLVRLTEHTYGLRSGATRLVGMDGRPVILDLTPLEGAP